VPISQATPHPDLPCVLTLAVHQRMASQLRPDTCALVDKLQLPDKHRHPTLFTMPSQIP